MGEQKQGPRPAQSDSIFVRGAPTLPASPAASIWRAFSRNFHIFWARLPVEPTKMMVNMDAPKIK